MCPENAEKNDKNDGKVAEKLLKEFGTLGIHYTSKESNEELMYKDIIETSIIAKIMRYRENLSAKSIKHILSKHNDTIGDSEDYLPTFLQTLKNIANIYIPKSVINEYMSIKNGNITNQYIEDAKDLAKIPEQKAGKDINRYSDYTSEEAYKCIAEEILRRRILGEIRLSQIKDIIEQNQGMTFDELSKHFDDIAYDFTTEGRRSEFLDSMELDLSEVDKKVLSNKELKELYSEINEIKDTPYEQLSEEQKNKVLEFKKFYESENKNHFNGYRLTTRSMRDENGYLSTYMTIMRNDFNNLTPEEMQKIQSECIGIDEETAFLDFETKMQGETSLSQYLTEYENYISNLDELMIERDNKRTEDEQLKDEISVEDLGKQTLEEQKDTKAKIDMEQKLQQKMKEYAISQEEKGEEK